MNQANIDCYLSKKKKKKKNCYLFYLSDTLFYEDESKI